MIGHGGDWLWDSVATQPKRDVVHYRRCLIADTSKCLALEFRWTVVNDGHTSSISLNSLQVLQRNFRALDGLHCCTGTNHHFHHLRNFCAEMLSGRPRHFAQFVPNVGRVALRFHEPKFTLTWLVAFFFILSVCAIYLAPPYLTQF